MSLEDSVRLTEILLACAFLQQSLEHFRGATVERRLSLIRFLLSLILLIGFQAAWVLIGLLILALAQLHRFQGPYNGGSDRMGLLLLCGLCLIHFLPDPRWQEYVLGYVAVQVVLSYFMSGWVKIANPQWRTGRALQDVFQFSAYPVSETLRGWSNWPRLLWLMSWAVIGFELLFPLTLLTETSLYLGLAIAAVFHLANACLFGLNRFLWVWLAAYPSVIWLQQRVIGDGLF